jgi:hypothetical protein
VAESRFHDDSDGWRSRQRIHWRETAYAIGKGTAAIRGRIQGSAEAEVRPGAERLIGLAPGCAVGNIDPGSGVTHSSTEDATVHLKRHLLTLTAAAGLAATGLAVAAPTHVFAQPSQNCNDGGGNEYREIPLITSPVVLAIEYGANNSALYPSIGICYVTSPWGTTTPETAGGMVWLHPNPYSNPAEPVFVGSASDPNAAVQANGTATLDAGYSITPGGAGSTGNTITLNIPFSVCVGPCTGSGAGLNPTGVLVGQLTPTPQPGIGAGYALQSLQVWVNGSLILNETPTTVAGAYVDPFSAVEQSLDFSQGGPCSSGVCVPKGYAGTTGNNLVGFTVLGVPVNIAPPKTCPYYNPNTSYCP